MLPAHRSLPPLRLRPRRRRHHRRRHHPRRRWPGGRPGLAVDRPRRWVRVARVALALASALAALAPALPAAGVGGAAALPAVAPTHVPPVDAPISDPFRPPAGPYGPGNRGLEYDTRPGTPVRASAAGAVVFAGPVGGALHVTLAHDDGVRTSYSFLASVEVVLGQQVDQGFRIATTGERLHFGARAGDAYFDPMSLFAAAGVEVVLLPFEVPPGTTPGAEARALTEMALAGGTGVVLPDLASTLDWLRERARSDLAVQLSPLGRGLGAAADLAERLVFGGPCSAGPPPARPAGGQGRVAVTVAGLGSSSDSGSIDELRAPDLGYDPDRVVRFSYAGGRTPGTGEAFDSVVARDYASEDTQGDVAVAAGRFADLVEQVAAADPDATVDVFAHSLGGLVVRLALVELDRRGVDLRRLGVVVTLGSPHQGADLATAVAAANTRLVPNLALDAAEELIGTGIDPDAPVVRQLAQHSDVVAGLAAGGVPEGVTLVSIAARGDLLVPAPRTHLDGAVEVTVPLAGWAAHGDLVGSPEATAEMARALAGQPPGCESWDDVVADVVAGHGIAAVEGHVGAMVASAGP